MQCFLFYMFILYHNGCFRPLLKMNFFSARRRRAGQPERPAAGRRQAGGESADPAHARAGWPLDVIFEINL
jgi:hypothetical protein